MVNCAPLRASVLAYLLLTALTVPVIGELSGRYGGADVVIRPFLRDAGVILALVHAALLGWSAAALPRRHRVTAIALGLGATLAVLLAALLSAWTAVRLPAAGWRLRLLTDLIFLVPLLRAGAWLALMRPAAGLRARIAQTIAATDLLLVTASWWQVERTITPALHPLQARPWFLLPLGLAGLWIAMSDMPAIGADPLTLGSRRPPAAPGSPDRPPSPADAGTSRSDPPARDRRGP